MHSDGSQGLATDAHLRLRSPADVLCAVPYLLGFHPGDSLVVVSLRDELHPQVSLTTRIDLPPRESSAEAAVQLAGIVVAQGCDAVLVAIICGADTDDTEPPRTDLVTAARAAFEVSGVPVLAAVWAPEVRAGAPWRCYDSGRGGQLSDPAASPLAAASVAAGQVTYPERRDLERMVVPTDLAALERRSELLDAYCDQESTRGEPADRDPAADGFALLLGWAERAGSGRLDLDDGEVIALCLALSDPMVRDAAFGLVDGPFSVGAERLWTVLVRESPDPEAAEPAVLLAHAALVRGNGALVGIALERAQRAWPGHRMSQLFQASLDSGLGRDELCHWFADGAACAVRLLRRREAR